MSDAGLYEPNEAVTCMCAKCRWVGTTKAPRFTCGGCGKYMASPMDRDKRRAKAAEARCKRLEDALGSIRERFLELSQETGPVISMDRHWDRVHASEIVSEIDAALSDTAQGIIADGPPATIKDNYVENTEGQRWSIASGLLGNKDESRLEQLKAIANGEGVVLNARIDFKEITIAPVGDKPIYIDNLHIDNWGDNSRREVEDMRERAAKAVEEMTLQITGNVSIRDQVACTIRALPLDPETGGADESAGYEPEDVFDDRIKEIAREGNIDD